MAKGAYSALAITSHCPTVTWVHCTPTVGAQKEFLGIDTVADIGKPTPNTPRPAVRLRGDRKIIIGPFALKQSPAHYSNVGRASNPW